MFRKLVVGSEIDSYCGRCKLLLNHVVVAMVEDKPRRVRCLTCQSEHNHRVPSTGKAKTTRKRSATGSKSAAASKTHATNRWREALAGWDGTGAKDYSIFESFKVHDWISHVTFGKGVVIDIPSPDRMITLFESGEKMLMQGKQRK